MSGQSSNASDKTGTNSNVGRLIEEYELTGVGEESEAYWKGTDRERLSRRELGGTRTSVVRTPFSPVLPKGTVASLISGIQRRRRMR